MKKFPRRTRLFLVALGAAALAGLSAGLVVSRDGTESARAQGPAGVVATGSFRPIAGSAGGTATVLRDASGRLKVRFSRNFTTRQVPELFVYLTRYERGQRVDSKEIAPLRSVSGGQEYDLPSEAASVRGLSIEILCSKCNKVSGAARLEPARRSRGNAS